MIIKRVINDMAATVIIEADYNRMDENNEIQTIRKRDIAINSMPDELNNFTIEFNNSFKALSKMNNVGMMDGVEAITSFLNNLSLKLYDDKGKEVEDVLDLSSAALTWLMGLVSGFLAGNILHRQ